MIMIEMKDITEELEKKEHNNLLDVNSLWTEIKKWFLLYI